MVFMNVAYSGSKARAGARIDSHFEYFQKDRSLRVFLQVRKKCMGYDRLRASITKIHAGKCAFRIRLLGLSCLLRNPINRLKIPCISRSLGASLSYESNASIPLLPALVGARGI